MKKIVITASPSKLSFTNKIAERIKEKSKDEIFVIDLYDKENELEFLSFQNVKKDFPIDDKIKKYQKMVSEADELIFVFPLWNFGEPAILKNFYDRVFTSHFAFKYVNGKSIGLLKGKTARFYITCDANKAHYIFLGNHLKFIWKYGRIRSCGIKMKNFTYFDKMRIRSDEERNKFLEIVEKDL
ncbi:MAG: NAD(P)H-dependent oxidoreductase [Nanoarchaeota archaeon]|nr:NAD(P)H-dependent oxidoreductase [Nanoarchaeota archaeon]